MTLSLFSCPLRHTSVSEEQQWFSLGPSAPDSRNPDTRRKRQRAFGTGKYSSLNFGVCRKVKKKIKKSPLLCRNLFWSVDLLFQRKTDSFSLTPCIKGTKRKRKEGEFRFRNKHASSSVWFNNRDGNIFHLPWCHVLVLVAHWWAKRMSSSRPRLRSPPFPDRVAITEDFVYPLSDYLFEVVSTKAAWGHTLNACIRGTRVERGRRREGVPLFPSPVLFDITVIKNNSGISRQPVNMMTEPIFAVWKMSELIPFKRHSLDRLNRLVG